MPSEGIELLRHETETTWFSKKAIPNYLKLLKRLQLEKDLKESNK